MRVLLVTIISAVLITSCRDKVKEKNVELKNPSAELEVPLDKTTADSIVPVFGYRFKVKGDFNGDGKNEEIMEHYYSGIDYTETYKFYKGLHDYSKLVELTIEKDPHSFIASSSKLVDTLHISSGGQHLGLSYLKNEGDLNGDGTDELSYVVNWADWSNLNTWHIMT